MFIDEPLANRRHKGAMDSRHLTSALRAQQVDAYARAHGLDRLTAHNAFRTVEAARSAMRSGFLSTNMCK
jgi:hypothetical protein